MRLAEPDKLRWHHGFVTGVLHLRVQIDDRADLRPCGDLRAFELRGGRWITRDDLRAQLVHHLGGEARYRVVFPDATLRFEFFAQCGDRRSVAAGAPLRNHGDLGFAGLGTERGWSGECRDGTGK